MPPVEFEYQLMIPALAVAPRVILPDPQIASGIVPVIVGMVFIVAVNEVREVVVQFPSVAST